MKKLVSMLSVAVCALMLFSCGGEAPKKQVPEKRIKVAVQLYSVRGDLEKDFYGTLKAVKDMGYEGVEFAGLYGHTPEQVKAWCKELGLTAVSAHVPFNEMLADMDKVINDYKTIGCEYIAVPWVGPEHQPDGEQYIAFLDDLKILGQQAKDAGITLLYHNHDFEFKLIDSGMKHKEPGLDFMYAWVPEDLLQTELDLCWVKYAGYDPVKYILKYSGRTPVLHFKDYYVEGEQEGTPYELIGDEKATEEAAKPTFEFRPLGQGVQDIQALLNAADESGCKWIVVEQDQPSMEKTPMECIKMSVEYLKPMRDELLKQSK